MQHFEKILLNVWRDACRHILIDEFTKTSFELLQRHLPIRDVIVRRLDPDHSSMVTIAVARDQLVASASEDRRVFTSPEYQQVERWCRGNRLLTVGKRRTGTLELVLPAGISEEVMAVPLAYEQSASGALILVARRNQQIDKTHAEMAEKLCEPFSVALENDRRIHEMASLREAAEADRGALLRRLGRTELGDTIIGEETGLRLVMERVKLVSASDVPVLVLGETGTGKEVIARAIHTRSDRHDGPFIRVNCGAIPSELIDSQLFGHERGSFTGAEQTRPGWFERADGGTLFLDEIGELPLEAQVRFLRVLQDGFVERVGSTNPIHVNVRIIAATHRDLAHMVREGRFREDLWYRLAVFPILMPPLRERLADIPALAKHFAERAAHRFGLALALPNEADVILLQSYSWPGNIREFGAVIDRAAILGDGQRLEIAKSLGFVSVHDEPAPPMVVRPLASRSVETQSPEVCSLDEAIAAHIEKALSLTHGRIEGKGGTAEILKINPHTLRARMRKLGIDWSGFRR